MRDSRKILLVNTIPTSTENGLLYIFFLLLVLLSNIQYINEECHESLVNGKRFNSINAFALTAIFPTSKPTFFCLILWTDMAVVAWQAMVYQFVVYISMEMRCKSVARKRYNHGFC